MRRLRRFSAAAVFVWFSACAGPGLRETPYRTENVFIVVMDGARFSETWGDPIRRYIPRLAGELAPAGAVAARFYNAGPTYTNAGHAALTTGFYQEINNNGQELPEKPSIFQLWRKRSRAPADKA